MMTLCCEIVKAGVEKAGIEFYPCGPIHTVVHGFFFSITVFI
jgi:hypothetical protein